MKKILDMTAGGKRLWFDSELPNVTFIDQAPKSPDVIKANWSDRLPFENGSFDMVVFDPPHLSKEWAGNGILCQAYGFLLPTWRADLAHGFCESFRVLKDDGILIFKWNTRQYSIHDVLELAPVRPLFGHTTAFTNKSTTIWCLFIKPGAD